MKDKPMLFSLEILLADATAAQVLRFDELGVVVRCRFGRRRTFIRGQRSELLEAMSGLLESLASRAAPRSSLSVSCELDESRAYIRLEGGSGLEHDDSPSLERACSLLRKNGGDILNEALGGVVLQIPYLAWSASPSLVNA